RSVSIFARLPGLLFGQHGPNPGRDARKTGFGWRLRSGDFPPSFSVQRKGRHSSRRSGKGERQKLRRPHSVFTFSTLGGSFLVRLALFMFPAGSPGRIISSLLCVPSSRSRRSE